MADASEIGATLATLMPLVTDV